jgi:hypothetical protein
MGYQGAQTKTSIPATVSQMRAGPTVTRSLKGDIKPPPAMGAKRIGAVANRYSMSIGPSNQATVPGGRGIMALNNVRLRPTANALKATVNKARITPASAPAPIKAQVKPGDVVKKTVGAVKSKAADVVRTVTNMKNSPTPKRGTNLGVKSGTQTGKTISRGGTGGRTTGGGRAAGGGYTNAGPAGPGASGRGTGGKR